MLASDNNLVALSMLTFSCNSDEVDDVDDEEDDAGIIS